MNLRTLVTTASLALGSTILPLSLAAQEVCTTKEACDKTTQEMTTVRAEEVVQPVDVYWTDGGADTTKVGTLSILRNSPYAQKINIRNKDGSWGTGWTYHAVLNNDNIPQALPNKGTAIITTKGQHIRFNKYHKSPPTTQVFTYKGDPAIAFELPPAFTDLGRDPKQGDLMRSAILNIKAYDACGINCAEQIRGIIPIVKGKTTIEIKKEYVDRAYIALIPVREIKQEEDEIILSPEQDKTAGLIGAGVLKRIGKADETKKGEDCCDLFEEQDRELTGGYARGWFNAEEALAILDGSYAKGYRDHENKYQVCNWDFNELRLDGKVLITPFAGGNLGLIGQASYTEQKLRNEFLHSQTNVGLGPAVRLTGENPRNWGYLGATAGFNLENLPEITSTQLGGLGLRALAGFNHVLTPIIEIEGHAAGSLLNRTNSFHDITEKRGEAELYVRVGHRAGVEAGVRGFIASQSDELTTYARDDSDGEARVGLFVNF